MRVPAGCFSCLMMVALALGVVAPAQAILITVSVIDDSSAITPASPANSSYYGHSVSVIDPGGSASDVVGSSVNAAVRYISNVAADSPGSIIAPRIESDYSLTVDITALPSETWSLDIGTRLTGSLTVVDDTTFPVDGDGTSSASVTDVTGYYNGVAVGELGLSSEMFQTATNLSGGSQTSVDESGLYSVIGTGSQSITLRFTWETRAVSFNFFTNGPGDEGAARFGFGELNSGISADNYPGVGNRNQANDGHFADLELTVVSVPEASSFVSAGFGMLLVGLFVRRSR